MTSTHHRRQCHCSMECHCPIIPAPYALSACSRSPDSDSSDHHHLHRLNHQNLPDHQQIPDSSRPLPKLPLVGLLLLALIGMAQSGPSPLLAELAETDGAGGTLWNSLEAADELQEQRERRARRLPVASLEGASGELGWRKRYYVSRWRGGRPNRRFVPVSKSEESVMISRDDEAKRLCGLKLTNRTKQLCGDCVPANMRQVILLDKKSDNVSASSKDRLTEMCCVQRCTDEQIRNFCCRGQL